jgi:hypothetical protein
VKVLDFGIAKLRGTLSGDAVRTQTGALMGTPPYMSPEQCRGISGEVDQRTDVYALGIILYEMLCGAPPFVGEGFGDILVQHLTQPPQPPRERNPEIPVALEKVILRALAKTTAQRYASMADLEAALEGRAVSDSGTTTLPTTTSGQLATAATTSMPFQRQTTTLSANAGEVEPPSDEVPAARGRKVFFVGGGAAAAAIALFLALRTPAPSPANHAAAAPAPVTAVPPPPRPALAPDAGVAAVVTQATSPPPTRRPAARKPGAAKPHPAPAADGSGTMRKW